MIYDPNFIPPTSDTRRIVVCANIFEGREAEAHRALHERLREELLAVVYKPEYEAIHARDRKSVV